MATTAIMQLAARYRVERVLLVSSSYVYGDFRYRPCDERHPTEPRTIYGAAKLTSEIVGTAFAARLKVPLTIVRPIAVYGPWDLNGILRVQTLRRAVETGQLDIGGGGPDDQGVDYTHISDAVRGLRLAVAAPECVGQTINIGRARELVGYAPQVGLAEGLRDCLAVVADLGAYRAAQARVGTGFVEE